MAGEAFGGVIDELSLYGRALTLDEIQAIYLADTAGKCPTQASSTLNVATAAGAIGGTATLSATLSSSGSPIAGSTVTFGLNGTPVGSATTDATGTATLTGVSLAGFAVGTHPGAVQASFAGDASYSAAASPFRIGTTFTALFDRRLWISAAVSVKNCPGMPPIHTCPRCPGTIV